MSAPKKLQRLSPEDYLANEEQSPVKHEYIDGMVFAMSGASRRHNLISLNLAFHLRAAARGGPCGVFISDMKARVRASNAFYYPDVMLGCDPADEHPLYLERPCLIAEVLSPSTESIDQREKRQAYQQLDSLRYYLLIDAEQVAVEYYLRGEDGEWLSARLDPGEVLNIHCPGYSAALSLEDLYEDTGLWR